MPRIDTIRIYKWLWLSVSVNDVSEYKYPRFGFTSEQAWNRTLAAMIRWEP